MNNLDSIPKKTLKRKVSIIAKCDPITAFKYISSSTKLSEWLKKSGPVPGAVSVKNLDQSYDFVGAKRHITFTSGETSLEELLTYNPPGNYCYRLSEFGGAFEKLTSAAYGELWFDNINGKTRITWEYSFTYRNAFTQIILSLFLTFFYKKFMKNGLIKAKQHIENIKVDVVQNEVHAVN